MSPRRALLFTRKMQKPGRYRSRYWQDEWPQKARRTQIENISLCAFLRLLIIVSREPPRLRSSCPHFKGEELKSGLRRCPKSILWSSGFKRQKISFSLCMAAYWQRGYYALIFNISRIAWERVRFSFPIFRTEHDSEVRSVVNSARLRVHIPYFCGLPRKFYFARRPIKSEFIHGWFRSD